MVSVTFWSVAFVCCLLRLLFGWYRLFSGHTETQQKKKMCIKDVCSISLNVSGYLPFAVTFLRYQSAFSKGFKVLR